MDPGAGGGGSNGWSLASKHRSLCHGSESSDASLLCSDGGPSVVGHSRVSPTLESSTGIRFSSFSASSSGHQQVLGVDKLRDHSSGSVVASTGMVPRTPTTGAIPSGGLTSSSGLLRQPHFHHFHRNPRLLRLHVWDCKAFCTGVGYIQCCGSSVGQLSLAFLAASLSTPLVGRV